MENAQENSDRRHYEKRGVAVPAEIQGRGPGDSALATLHKQLVKRYGEGWEVDSVYPGAICDNAEGIDMEEGHMVIFKRRRQLRDE
ncbi:hypothetical protein [Candidatus Nitronereus thalassa]|uniref:DUF4177 domain-containing protein n=1 Tax=Candidatus Nitronereus thalassa TaxID=3020898 RepID=A0ABU3K759_9BACT|nr:hypothetical protein [Candidatus Nitronereus thalassa]MDT7042193.1 hypothetical protein [Candidatus Nitronereus thalassa]